MKKILLVPDSFKGTISASRVCGIMRAAIHARFPNCEVVSIPVADGGEGTVDCFLAAVGGEKIPCRVTGPLGGELDGFYGLLPGNTAVVELAAAAGLHLVKGRENPCATSTFGVGELLLDAVKRGCKRLVVGLGGSCTNDLGCGVAAAAGARFYDANGGAFIPVGGTLGQIADVDVAPLRKNFEGVSVTVMCDVDNPLFGARGAAKIYAPQKGATPEMVDVLDANVRAAAAVIERKLGVEISNLPGAGAAGGAGAGMVAFFGATLQPGITAVLDATRFDAHLHGADFVFTGEGRVDAQTARGKVVAGVARRVAGRVPVVAVAGAVEDPVDELFALGVTAVFSATRRAALLDPARCEADLAAAMENICRLL
ncbi:MAG: glycerate kinase [Kiritimatiellaeota bacterium]|nr:glycerate kinase [Kiritimatiellota bacterium]